jgi:ferredoxin-NADP reductase
MKQWLDHITGRVTMYRTVTLSLVAITVYAFVLSLLGTQYLFYRPLELLAALAVAVIASIGSSFAVSRIFRAQSHLESALITGLLLFIILLPSTEPLELLYIAIAAVVASLSKYVLAWRGRHIFNPAAIGAVAVTATGLTSSGWWVANPYILPLVAIAAFVILYRTRRLDMGAVFIAVALIVYAIRWVAFGDSPIEGIRIALTSVPVIFFAGFMLSEPLTMPPLKRQQLGYALTVALLFSIAFHVGPVFSTPQLALVIGNLIAFFFGQRRDIRLSLVEKTQLTPTTWEFSFRPARPVRFTPGQYMELTVPHRKADLKGLRRVFSISSAPGEVITFALKITDEVSSFKQALLALEPGSTVRGTLVAGDFVLPEPSTPLLLVAGGIGITPFASQLAHDQASGLSRDVVVAYAVSDPAELAYSDLLKSSGARVIVSAPTKPATLPTGWIYAGTRLTGEVLSEHVPDLASRRTFISGPPALVNTLRVTLRKLGAKRVTTDYFSGY